MRVAAGAYGYVHCVVCLITQRGRWCVCVGVGVGIACMFD